MSEFGKQVGGTHYKEFSIQPTEYCHKKNFHGVRAISSSMCLVIPVRVGLKT